jgi:hypothetical protein
VGEFLADPSLTDFGEITVDRFRIGVEQFHADK